MVSAVSARTVPVRGIPHFAKKTSEMPNFLDAALDKSACAPFFKERRTKSVRKSGMWGTRPSRVDGIDANLEFVAQWSEGI
jgi:hypothetical protein